MTTPTCPTCGEPRLYRFCGTCGEEAVHPEDLSFRRFVRGLGNELVPGLDGAEDEPVRRMGGRIYRTVYTLFRHPGQLTADYIAGRRRPYLKPIQVFLTITVIFFLFGHNYFQYDLGEYEYIPGYGETAELVAAEIQKSGLSRAQYEERFDERLNTQKRAMIALTVPIFALGFVPLYWRLRYGEHLVFSIHFVALLLLFMVTIMYVLFRIISLIVHGIIAIAPGTENLMSAIFDSEWTLVLLIYLPLYIYLVKAVERVYGDRRRVAVVKALVLLSWHIVMILFVFRLGLFFTTFYSLKWFS